MSKKTKIAPIKNAAGKAIGKTREVLFVVLVAAVIFVGGGALGWFFSTGDVPWGFASNARDLVVALVASVGAATALLGLKEWKRQKEYDFARRFLKVVFELRDAIHAFRGPIWNVSFDDMSNPKKIYDGRFQRLMEAALAVESERREAQVLWGSDEVAKVLEPLLSLSRDVRGAYEECFSSCPKEKIEGMGEDMKNFCREQWAILEGGYYDGYKGKFDEEVDKTAAAVEKWLGPKLGR